MIKRYYQFIKESLDPEDLREYFIDLIDSGIDLSIENDEIYFEEKYSPMLKKYYISEVDFEKYEGYQKLLSGSKYYKGFKISLALNKFNGDLTSDFKNSVSQIESFGFKLLRMTSLESNEYDYIENDLKIDDLSLNWEDSDHDNEYSNYIKLYFHNEEEIKLTDVDIAEYYCWTNWEENESKEIYFNTTIGNLVQIFIKEKNYYYKFLSEEDYIINDHYRNNGEYSPKIKELGDTHYYLSDINIIKIMEIIIKNSNGWDSFYRENKDIINANSKNKFLKRIIEDRKLLNEIFDRSSENESSKSLLDDIRWMIGDHSSSAHADKNQKEIWDSFYNMIGNHIKYEEVENETLRVYFQNVWMESPLDLINNELESVFSEWVSENISDHEKELKPRLSDWGDVDRDSLNRDILEIIANHR